MDKKLARNVDLMISAELVKQLFDELTGAGFTKQDAIDYITSLVVKTSMANKKSGEKNDK